MSDDIDRISEGQKVDCIYHDCQETFEDINPDVALAIRNNHIRKKHPFEEE